MSWFTRCPACGVTYAVVPDQLKVAQGWLRCGQCQQAFDSTGMVLPWPVDVEAPQPSLPTEAPSARLDLNDFLQHEDKSALQTPVAAFEEALSTFKPQPLPTTATAPSSAVWAVPLGDLLAPNTAPNTAPNMAPEEEPAVLTPKASSWWSTLLAWGLLLALLLQWGIAGRDKWVAAEPSFAPPLQAACRLLGCEMVPPAVRDGVVIENSSMAPRDGGLALLWSVRNVTRQTLEMPALELTWLDAQDKVLLRRVFRPTEQDAPAALTPGQIWQGQLQLLPAEGLQPMGYRLVNFYP
ncbi:zinc-ribbon and DUF3426 domain-containing protein [Limnohabitans sp. G3-2]|uniref:zinc-ribbon and DUF3426 domain-containing protein n=1 Tax=Limnohabitans sp. G3-2 TaxID=1100711 RepID=UPI000C1EED6A|nr:zinc-ribbon and DUF3426 domain-containing protein [Limnohabitans sp. G3-2]PIT75763.1 hypothetical protein B9Z31_05700 [Limnohabitans sp. G3-2]